MRVFVVRSVRLNSVAVADEGCLRRVRCSRADLAHPHVDRHDG